MNRIYRSIWNHATGAYAAVSENVKSAGKRALPGSAGASAPFALTTMAAALMLGFGTLAVAAPTGGVVVAGSASIGGAAGATVITQASQNAVLNWNSFNVAAGESVTFAQPNSASVALNRILGGDGSAIMGTLSANGKVFLVNPNGVLFGKGASVNVGGLVASTLDIRMPTSWPAPTLPTPAAASGQPGASTHQAATCPAGRDRVERRHHQRPPRLGGAGGRQRRHTRRRRRRLAQRDGRARRAQALVNNGGLIQADGGRCC